MALDSPPGNLPQPTREVASLQAFTLDLDALATYNPAADPAAAWQLLPTRGSAPCARTAAATALLPRSKLLVHGGVTTGSMAGGLKELCVDAFLLCLLSGIWTPLQPQGQDSSGLTTGRHPVQAMAPRHGHCAVAVPSAQCAILVGGSSDVQQASAKSVQCLQLALAAVSPGTPLLLPELLASPSGIPGASPTALCNAFDFRCGPPASSVYSATANRAKGGHTTPCLECATSACVCRSHLRP